MALAYWRLGKESYPSLCCLMLSFQLGTNMWLQNLSLLGPSLAQLLERASPSTLTPSFRLEPVELLKDWLCSSPTPHPYRLPSISA